MYILKVALWIQESLYMRQNFCDQSVDHVMF